VAGRLDDDDAGKRHSPEQVVHKLAMADGLLGKVGTLPMSVVSDRFRADLLPLAQPVRRREGRRCEAVKDLERENATLKRLLADAELQKAALKAFARGNF
jgi:hypothetical protein